MNTTTVKNAGENKQTAFVLWLLTGVTLFAPLIDGGTTHYPVFFIRATLIVASAVMVMKGMSREEIVIPRDSHLILASVLLGLAVVSFLWVPYLSGGLQWVLSLGSYTVFFALLLRGMSSSNDIRHFLMVLGGMGIGEALLGMLQYAWLGYPRAQGTFFNPNFFATYMGAIFSVGFGVLAFSSHLPRSNAERVLLWSTLATTGPAFVLAQSRGAVAALLCSIGVIGFARFGKRFGMALAALLMIVIFVPNPIRQRAVDVAAHDPYAYSRLDIWASSLHRIVDQPFGVGAGMYKYTSFAYRFPIDQDVARFGKRAESAHNEYLQLAVELGIVGLLIVAAAIVLWIARVRALLRCSLEPWDRGVVIGLAAGTAVILAHAMVDSVFHEPALMLLLTLLGGMVIILGGQSMEGSLRSIRVPVTSRPMTVALVLSGTVLAVFLVARPAVAWYEFEAGDQAYRTGGLSKAIVSFARATAIDPGVTGYHDALARAQVRAYEQSGDLRLLDEAIDELQIGYALNRRDARFPARLGTLSLILARRAPEAVTREQAIGRAAAYFHEAVGLDPYTPSSYYDLAKIRLAQNNREEARRLLSEAIAYEPNFLPARALLAELAVRMGNPDVARREYESIIAAQARYSGRELNASEREFLDVDASRVGRLVTAQPAS